MARCVPGRLTLPMTSTPARTAGATGSAPALRTTVLLLAMLAAGLQAGFYYAYSVSVIPGLRTAEARTLVDGMQQINIAIINPGFLVTFLGTPVLIAVAGLLHLRGDRGRVKWIAVALVLSILTVMITGAINIPLNDALDAAGRPGAITDLEAVRSWFVEPWLAGNAARLATSLGALAALGWSFLRSRRSQ